jgi:hypothetical protein
MILVINIDEIQPDYIFLSPPVKNKLETFNEFIKIIYSTDIISINVLHVLVDLNNTLANLTALEEMILNKYAYSHKQPVFNMVKNVNKYANTAYNSFIVRISGIWVNDKEYGITSKILQ